MVKTQVLVKANYYSIGIKKPPVRVRNKVFFSKNTRRGLSGQ